MTTLRYRSERLHTEIVNLQLHPGNFSDLQRLQKEWGSHAHYDGVCTQEHCDYEILLTDPLTAILPKSKKYDSVFWTNSQRWNWYSATHLLRIYRSLGGRPASTSANLKIHSGII